MEKTPTPKSIQAVRGMNDILPSEIAGWHFLEDTLRQLLTAYGYEEIRTPIIEMSELFHRSIGEVTDIVEKEMYTFADRNGDSLTLRPEGTASVVRAALEHSLLVHPVQRLWYRGPMFRHERPQKGRYRQFHQLGAEVFGLAGPDIDAEMIAMTARLWQQLGLSEAVELQINSLGNSSSRQAYRKLLLAYFQDYHDQLDEESQRRLHTNPLRILDSKNPAMLPIIAAAPQMTQYLDGESADHFQQLEELLQSVGVHYTVNPALVRGLDYYGKTVFEWITNRLGAQGTVCAGGRYDGLVTQLGGKPTPAVGFALGLERLLALLLEVGEPPIAPSPHAYLVVLGEAAQPYGLALAEQLRTAVPPLRLQLHCGGGSGKSQFKRADKSGAAVVLILGEAEVASGEVGYRPLTGDAPQQQLTPAAAVAVLQALVAEQP